MIQYSVSMYYESVQHRGACSRVICVPKVPFSLNDNFPSIPIAMSKNHSIPINPSSVNEKVSSDNAAIVHRRTEFDTRGKVDGRIRLKGRLGTWRCWSGDLVQVKDETRAKCYRNAGEKARSVRKSPQDTLGGNSYYEPAGGH